MISGTQLKYRLRIPARVTNRMAHGATLCCSLSLLPKWDREIKTKEETREEGKERSFLVRLVFLLYAHTPCKHVYTPCVRIVPHSKSSQGPQPVPSLPFFPPSLPLLLHDLCLFRSLVADTRPTCKSCRDLVYLRDSRFPTTGVFPPTKLDRPLSGRFFSSVFLFSFSFSSLSLAGYSFGLLVWGEKLIGRSIIVSFLRRYGNGLKKELHALLSLHAAYPLESRDAILFE